ncbi:type VII toxin-antitoxin system HepT family RNase toxin [Marinomonas balearica]|uniref:Uncharacterized protein YutE (UPF0331/DUF86 family) n=1 Tax=Marinomonas balearica TaxID=491947 RepID=A0A4R6M887_9GAMM|nr:DUF86 domain-containing protein [Marinomonas balearica]TDO97554.1 uncharacterized protein YutE (UPF0331/DUF86 family) [Marinomonas balearica]
MVLISDAIHHKFASIEHAVKRIEEVYFASSHFENDLTRQDSVIFNLQRACEASIDIANILNKHHKTGVPQSGVDSFEQLKKVGLLSAQLADNLQKMVGVRDIAVSDYQNLNLERVKHVVEHKLSELSDFIEEVKQQQSTLD